MLVRNGALVMSVNNPATITVAIPTAKEINFKGRRIVAVKHTLDSTRVLRNLGLDAPSPILYDGFVFGGRFKPMAHQTQTAEFLTLHTRAFVFNTMGCVDSKTEYLSPTGWKRIADYDGGMIAQFNKHSRQMTFVQPTDFVKKPCTQMIRFKTSRGVDQLLSPEHRVLYTASTGKLMVDSAQSIMDKDAKAKLGWSGKFLTTFTPKITSSLSMTEAELRLMVAVIADGHFGKSTNRCVVRLKKERKVRRMHHLLVEAGVEYSHRLDTSESGYGFTVFTFDAPRREKDFRYWWSASLEQLQLVTDEVFNWDGSKRKAGAADFSTSVKESADFVQYACAASGRTASLNEFSRGRRGKVETEYVVHARDKAYTPGVLGVTSEGEKIQNINYEPSTDGFKYCFSVPDTFWVMRRNGNITITGNTGKTAAALWTAEYLKQRGYVKKVLIISPLSVMDVWANEAFACIPHRTVTQLVGKRERRIDLLNSGADICVINFDGLVSIQEAVAKWQPDLVIVDEADAYCNPQTKRYKALTSILKSNTRLWLLTGTPVSNAPTDAYGLIKLVRPRAIPASFNLFRETLMIRNGPYKWFPKPGAVERVFELMQPAIRFTKKDCMDLPPITFNMRAVQMSETQLDAFEAMKATMRHEDEESGVEVRAANAAVKLIKLQQILCGAVKDVDGNPVYLDPKGRLDITKELCDGSEGKVIIFVPFIHAMHMVQNHLTQAGYETFLVNGEVSKAARTEIFARFQREDTKQVLVAHPKVAAHGLTLTAANTIIWYAPTFSIGQYLQANARIDRTGQELPMSVYNLYSHPVERTIYGVLQSRENMQSRMLDLYTTALA